MQQTPRSTSTGRAQTIAPAQTRAELDALDMKRTELRRQLESNIERRALLGEQMRQSQGTTAQRDIEARIKALDDRSANIDQQLNQIDDVVSAALASGITVDRSREGVTIVRPGGQQGITILPPRFGRDTSVSIAQVMFFEGLGFMLLGLILWRVLRRRGPASAVRLAPEESGRLEQLQRSIDVIALEVERISEGQRYVTKVLGEKQPVISSRAGRDS